MKKIINILLVISIFFCMSSITFAYAEDPQCAYDDSIIYNFIKSNYDKPNTQLLVYDQNYNDVTDEFYIYTQNMELADIYIYSITQMFMFESVEIEATPITVGGTETVSKWCAGPVTDTAGRQTKEYQYKLIGTLTWDPDYGIQNDLSCRITNLSFSGSDPVYYPSTYETRTNGNRTANFFGNLTIVDYYNGGQMISEYITPEHSITWSC